MKTGELVKLAICLVICQLPGVIGSLFTAPAIPVWYAQLKKPAFTPPGWVFGPVWITLYVLMGVALFLIWQRGMNYPGVKIAMVIFIIQLMLNALWSILFFGMHSPSVAFAEILILWLAIAASIFYFYRLSIIAALLLVPYILWVSFAAVLNYSIMKLN